MRHLRLVTIACVAVLLPCAKARGGDTPQCNQHLLSCFNAVYPCVEQRGGKTNVKNVPSCWSDQKGCVRSAPCTQHSIIRAQLLLECGAELPQPTQTLQLECLEKKVTALALQAGTAPAAPVPAPAPAVASQPAAASPPRDSVTSHSAPRAAQVSAETLKMEKTRGKPAWRNTQWGMSVEEVLAALPGEATRVNGSRTDYGTTLAEVSALTIGPGAYKAELDFDSAGGLSFVRIASAPLLTCDSIRFDRLVDLLLQKYGAPLSDQKARSGDREMAWNTPHALIKAFYNMVTDGTSVGRPDLSAAWCGVTYQPPGREGTDKL